MIVDKTATGRSSKSLKVLWKLVEAEDGREKITTLKIGNFKCGRVPSVSSAVNAAKIQSSSSALPSQGPIPVGYTAGSASAGRSVPSEHTADTIAHEVSCYEHAVRSPIGGEVHKRPRRVRVATGNTVVEGCGIGDIQP